MDFRSGKYYEVLAQRMKRNEIIRLLHFSLKNHYVYFAIPKNASSTVKHLLHELEFLGSPFSASKHVHDRMASPLLASYQLTPGLMDEALSSPNFRRFVVVRHPVSRILSCYLDRIQRPTASAKRRLAAWLRTDPKAPISFSEFVNAICERPDSDLEQHFKLQTDIIAYPDIPITDVVKFEALHEELPPLLSKLGLADAQITKYMSPPPTGADSKIAEYYSRELADKVEERYRADMDAFGFPRTRLDSQAGRTATAR